VADEAFVIRLHAVAFSCIVRTYSASLAHYTVVQVNFMPDMPDMLDKLKHLVHLQGSIRTEGAPRLMFT
jgi:hypothetical protein